MCSLQIVCLCFNILLYFQIEKRWPDGRCVTCLGRDHAEGALSGKAPVCSICASLPLAKAPRRLAFWKRKDAEETALVSASSALDLVSVSSRLAAAAPLPGLSPSPPPVSPGA